MVTKRNQTIILLAGLALGFFLLSIDPLGTILHNTFDRQELPIITATFPIPDICVPVFGTSDLSLSSPRDYFPPEDPERTGIFWGIQSQGYEGSIVIEALVDGETTDIESLTLRNEDGSFRSSGIVSPDAKMARDAELINRCEIIIANVVIDPDNLTQEESLTIFVTRADGSRISDRVIILLEQFPQI